MQFVAIYRNKRSACRRHVFMVGKLFTPDGVINVRIHDLSRNGANVTFETQIPSDCDVILEHDSLFVAARIAWVRASQAGLKFYREIEL